MTQEYNNLAKRMIDILKLRGSPVGVAFQNEIPQHVEKGKEARHCEMVQYARLNKSEFYSTAKEQKCKGGAAVMGLMDLPENVASGEFYYKLGAFASLSASRNTMQLVPKIEQRSKVIMYAPLDTASFSPDVVVVICNPKQAMQIVQAELYCEGGRIETGFSGKQSLCGDIVANTMITKRLQVSLACSGSRKHGKLEDNELIVGIPAQRLEALVYSLEKLFSK